MHKSNNPAVWKLTSVPDEEVVEVVICVRVLGLEGEHWGVGRRVELDHGLHRQGPVDEVRRLVIDVLHLDDHPLVVSVYNFEILDFQLFMQVSTQNDGGTLTLKFSSIKMSIFN